MCSPISKKSLGYGMIEFTAKESSTALKNSNRFSNRHEEYISLIDMKRFECVGYEQLLSSVILAKGVELPVSGES